MGQVSKLKMDDKNYSEIYTFLLSMFILIPVINQNIIALFPTLSGNVMSLLYLVIGLLLSVVVSICKQVAFSNAVVMIGLSIIYFITLVFQNTVLGVTSFLIYVVIPLLFVKPQYFKLDLMVEICLIVSSVTLPLVNKIFTIDNNGYIDMGISYAFLLSSIVPIFYLFGFSKRKKLFGFLSVINLIYVYEIFLYGSRGCVLSIALVMFYLYLSKSKGSRKGYHTIILVLSFVLVVLIICFYKEILVIIGNLLSNIGYYPAFIRKIIRLSLSSNLLNGRDEIYEIAISGFFDNPIFGKGIDSFGFYTNLLYPHNFILQFLYEIGIVGTLFIVTPCSIGFRSISKNWDPSKKNILAILFLSSVPGALFSQNVWSNMILWVTISYMLNGLSKNSIRIKCIE